MCLRDSTAARNGATRSRTNRENQDSFVADGSVMDAWETLGNYSSDGKLRLPRFSLLPRNGILDETRLTKNGNRSNSGFFEASGRVKRTRRPIRSGRTDRWRTKHDLGRSG